MAYLYILSSEFADCYYIGSTNLTPEERLGRQLRIHKGFTSRAQDWEIVYTEYFKTNSEDRRREYEIKGWKSKEKIKQLINNNR